MINNRNRIISSLRLLIFAVALILPMMLKAETEHPVLATNQITQSERSDSLIVNHLRHCGVKFSHDNSVTLLMTGQEKFDDLFKAIDEARSSIHMEYFNFRNDSINRVLISHLAPKVKRVLR